MLNYIYRYPKADGSIAFLDILIHANKGTSIYRKPTNINLYTHYSSSASMSSKESTVRTEEPLSCAHLNTWKTNLVI